MTDGSKEQPPTVNQSVVIVDFAARTRHTGGWSTHNNVPLPMNYPQEVTAVAPHFSTKGRTVETRKTIVMLIIPWLETSKEMCHWYPKLKKKRLILLTKASLRTRKRLSTPQLSQFLCSMKPGGFSHYSKWGKNLYNIWFDERKWGVGEKKKNKTRQKPKACWDNLFKCPAGPEQCRLVVRDISGRGAEEEGIGLGSLT